MAWKWGFIRPLQWRKIYISFWNKSPARAMMADSVRSQGIKGGTNPARTKWAGVAWWLGVLALHVLVHSALVSTCVRAHCACKGALRQTRDQTPNGVIWIWEKRKTLTKTLFSKFSFLQNFPSMFVFYVLLQIAWSGKCKGAKATGHSEDDVIYFNVIANVCSFLVREVALGARPDSLSI